MYSPDIFILDDPTSSLDNKVTVDIMKVITKKPWNEKTFVLSTNNTKLLEFVDRILLIEKGRIKFDGNFNDFKQNPEFRLFLKEDQQKEENRTLDQSKPKSSTKPEVSLKI
jgi:ABC-type multidrug transport system ATPase subunit